MSACSCSGSWVRVAGRLHGGTDRARRGVHGWRGSCTGWSVLPGDGGACGPCVIRAASPAVQSASTPVRSMIEVCDHGHGRGPGHAGVRDGARPRLPRKTLSSWVSSAGVNLRLHPTRRPRECRNRSAQRWLVTASRRGLSVDSISTCAPTGPPSPGRQRQPHFSGVDAKRYSTVRLVPSRQVTIINGSIARSDITCLRVITAIPGAALIRAR